MTIPSLSLSKIDVSYSATLLGRQLTPMQGNQRLRELELARKIFQDQGKDLSPRSQRELKELAELFSSHDERVLTVEKITREDPRESYYIVFNSKVELKEVITQITALNKHISDASQLGILKALTNPPESMTWYQTAVNGQMNAVVSGDFLDALKHNHLANLNLLNTSAHLQGSRNVAETLLELHKKFTSLYQYHINFNRSCEVEFFILARQNQNHLTVLLELINADSPNPVISTAIINQIMLMEAKQLLVIQKAIYEASEDFLKNLALLNQEIPPVERTVQAMPLAAISLATVKLTLKGLKEALEIRKSQAKAQIEQLNKLVDLQGQQRPFQTVQDIVEYVSELNIRNLATHAYMIQVQKQIDIIHLVRKEEENLKWLVTKGLNGGTQEGIEAVNLALKAFEGQVNPLFSKLPSNQKLLDDIQILTK